MCAEYNSLNSLVSEAFIRFFLETIGHYSLFITQNERGERVFQREAFRKSVASKSIRRFLGVFMESQMFAGFIQDRELRKTRAKGSFPTISHQSVLKERVGAAVTLIPSGECYHSMLSPHGHTDIVSIMVTVNIVFAYLLTGLFEQRVEQYLEELPDTEQSGVNKFLKGLGEFCSRHTRQGPEGRSAQFTQLNRCLNSVSRKQNEVPPQKELRGNRPVNPEA